MKRLATLTHLIKPIIKIFKIDKTKIDFISSPTNLFVYFHLFFFVTLIYLIELSHDILKNNLLSIIGVDCMQIVHARFNQQHPFVITKQIA